MVVFPAGFVWFTAPRSELRLGGVCGFRVKLLRGKKSRYEKPGRKVGFSGGVFLVDGFGGSIFFHVLF